MFKVNNKDTKTTLMASYFTPCSSVSIVNFEHAIAGWEMMECLNPRQNLEHLRFVIDSRLMAVSLTDRKIYKLKKLRNNILSDSSGILTV